MRQPTAIRFSHVCKSYPSYAHVLVGAKEWLLHLPRLLRALRNERFFALNDVSFEIQRGETVGLIGANGSGKSTALSLIAGVLKAQVGQVSVAGRVAPLLELGAGFHPELSGRENILLNGVLLGLTKRELEAKIDVIIAFSELGRFLNQPIRTYSSGMLARLGFSIAIHLDPDILLVDEVLAVGDMHFQKKCLDRLAAFKARGTTIVIVSHNAEDIRRLCDRALWLKNGVVAMDGKPDLVLKEYQNDAAPETARAEAVADMR